MNVSSERGKKQIEPNYSTWCGASWFSALTRQASTSSEGTNRMGLQPGQLWRSSTNQLNGLVFNHRWHSSLVSRWHQGRRWLTTSPKQKGSNWIWLKRGKWSQMLSSQRWFSRVFQVTSTVWWQSSTSAQQRGTTRWSRTWSTSQQPGVSVFPARHRWQHFTQPGGSLQSASSVERWGTELRTATVGRRGLASTVVRRGIWLQLAGRDSKRAQVEDVARVNPATNHQRTSSASGLSGLVATTKGALSFSLTLGATASWSRTKSSSLIWTRVFWQTYATLTAVVQRSEDVGQCDALWRTKRAVLVYWNWRMPSGYHPTRGIWCRSSDWRTRGLWSSSMTTQPLRCPMELLCQWWRTMNFSVWWLNLWRRGNWQWCLTLSSTGIEWWGTTTGTMWQSCSKRSWVWTSLAPRRRRTATSAAPRRRSGHPFRRRGALEQKRNWLSFTQTCSDPFNRSPTRVFAMQWASSTVTTVSGQYTQ